jgi:hypothetical protein
MELSIAVVECKSNKAFLALIYFPFVASLVKITANIFIKDGKSA